MTLWRMRIACWTPKATNTLRICNTYFFSTATVVARTHLSVTLYVRCLSCPRSVDFTYHLSFSCWATVSSASSHTLRRTQSVLNCWVWSYISRESQQPGRDSLTPRVLYIGKSLLMLQEIICSPILLTIHGVNTKLKWRFYFRKTQTFDLNTKFPKMSARTQICKRQKADMEPVP